MAELVRLAAADAVVALRAARVRGFLGLDPVTANDALLLDRLLRQPLSIFTDGSAVLGHRSDPLNPRQVEVACSTADPRPLERFLRFVGGHRRCRSFLAVTVAGEPSLPALLACGFVGIGVLRQHEYRGGRYHDVQVHHRAWDEVGQWPV